jgi:hypothetical protein
MTTVAKPARPSARAVAAVVAVAAAIALAIAPAAVAGTYPMYQCGSLTPAVAPGWSASGADTQASTVLSNGCADGGAIGDYVFSNGQAGAVTENGSNGSQVVLALDVPASSPDVTIKSISAHAVVSPVTGDDAFLGFSSAGQSLPGLVELPYGASGDFSADESWTLPGDARDFEAFVNCTTDRSSPTCEFSDSSHVPALNDIVVTLTDSTPPSIGAVTGPLASAAAADATVSGIQTLAFNTGDVDSGVRSATLTLTPAGGRPAYTKTIDYPCSYDSWNACPVTESGSSFALDTSTLSPTSYAVELSVTDAAGNVTTDPLGTITPAIQPLQLGTGGLGTSAPWQVSLRVSPRRVRVHTLIRLNGHVATSPRPPLGKLIDLQARTVTSSWRPRHRHRRRVSSFGPWITFRLLRARPDGAFNARYRFRFAGEHRYQFEAVAPAEGGYRDATGHSAAVTVTEG